MSVGGSPNRVQRSPSAPRPPERATPSVPGSAGSDWDRWPRPGPTRKQQLNDVWLAGLVALGAVVTTLLVNSMGAFAFGVAPSLGEQLVWGLCLTAPLAFRRRYPATVVLVVSAIFIASQYRENGDNLVPSIVLFLAVYSLGAWGRDRSVARWVRVGVIVAMFGWLGFSTADALRSEPDPMFEAAAGPLDPLLASALYGIGFNLMFFLAAYFFGSTAWESARRRHQLELQGEQLRRSQEENARQAVVAERVRIARDLHDVVAHHVSVMGVQATAARRVLRSDYDTASQALEAVERTARTAVAELRGLLGVLRADPAGHRDDEARSGDAGHASSPGLDQLPDLVAETRATGLDVEYAVYGERRSVPDAVALSAYRVVQEALTNAVKHAAATTVDVRVRFLELALEVEVADDGRGQPAWHAAEPVGGGLGLMGMRERVAVHGGELDAGHRPSGGFLVRAGFPLHDPDDAGNVDRGDVPHNQSIRTET